MPPPAEGFASRLFLGPALRTQPDRRLVTLVREGYETAFDEIVRRYAAPLRRYAAAIVGGHAEDVTQDSFSKALLALRRDDAEIELRPWLYRIVRNTALNDLRDRPREAEALAEEIASGRTPAEQLEEREELTDLMRRLRALPEAQRAAIVMRELEGLSHDEIAAALGISGGAARQAIHRARTALRDGVGLLLPLPLLKVLIDHGGEAVAAGAGVGTTAAAGGLLGGAGAGTALKAGVVTAVLAGSVGAGVAIHENRDHLGDGEAATASAAPPGRTAPSPQPPATEPSPGVAVDEGEEAGDDKGRGSSESGEDRGGGDRQGEDAGGDFPDDTGHGERSGHGGHGRGPGPPDDSRSHGQRGPREHGENHGGGSGPSGHEGRGPRFESEGGPHSGPGGGGSGSDSGGLGHRGPGGGRSSGEDSATQPPPPPPDEDAIEDNGDGGGSNSGPGSGDDDGGDRPPP